MKDREHFVSRWSRLKRGEAATQPDEHSGDAARRSGEKQARGRGAGPAAEVETGPQRGRVSEKEFDVSTLPPIESITAGTDVSGFLQSGVPIELAKAALRKAWTSDPAIRDFIGLAENQWDFTDPTAIPGFGPLQPGDAVSGVVEQAVGKLAEKPASVSDTPADDRKGAPLEEQRPSVPARVSDAETTSEEGVVAAGGSHTVAMQHGHEVQDDQIPAGRRTHGRALPR